MMSRNCGWNVLGLLAATVMLNGCGSMVFPDFEDDGEIVIEVKDTVKYCHNCGKQLTNEETYCSSCGTKVK